MYINLSDIRETTFTILFRKTPYFNTQLTEILLRSGIDKNITIPSATDDLGYTVYYTGVHDLPAGALVNNTVDYGNTFEFKDITDAMNGTFEFNVSACTSID